MYPCCLQGRIKSLYSIQRKMRRKKVSLEEVYDARALRVVVDDADGDQQVRLHQTALGRALVLCRTAMSTLEAYVVVFAHDPT